MGEILGKIMSERKAMGLSSQAPVGGNCGIKRLGNKRKEELKAENHPIRMVWKLEEVFGEIKTSIRLGNEEGGIKMLEMFPTFLEKSSNLLKKIEEGVIKKQHIKRLGILKKEVREFQKEIV